MLLCLCSQTAGVSLKELAYSACDGLAEGANNASPANNGVSLNHKRNTFHFIV
jgi:hypothetical protein